MATNRYWARAQECFRAGDRSWIHCPKNFWHDMLECVPPAMMDFHPVFGCYFANGEPWTHTQQGAIFLCFRAQPEHMCRMASLQEFRAEIADVPLPGWRPLTEQEITYALEEVGPKDYDQYQSEEYKLSFQRSALEQMYCNIVRIPGKGWYAAQLR